MNISLVSARNTRRLALKRIAAAVALLPVALSLDSALAQDYPAKSITAVVPFAAGGGSDTQTRIWGDAMAQLIGHRIIVENVPATAGVSGTKQGIAAEPDGYTVVMGVASTIAINPVINKAADYKPLEDLQPVALTGYTPYVMVVANNLNIKTLPELIEYGKAHEGELTYAGWTTVGEFARKGLELQTGLKMIPVPYKGNTEAMTDVIAGRASAAILDISSALPFIRSGSVTPIVMTGPDKSSALPDVQTIDEAGVKNYFIDSWTAIFAPKDTPKEIVEYLNAKTREALKSEKAKARFDELAIEFRDYDVSQTREFMEKQVAGWKTLIEKAGAAK
ncbi:tripartite tricarboxylate transporter substrate binding protein [Mesorhizobium sp. M0938]|uniref:Bug family tripartite tricarboxylate transporter substrate binding protein n=1 Tax=unclassified Mesorhizobium TaxID=325217 RepID=UPI003339FA44